MGVISDRRRRQKLRRAGRIMALCGIAALLGISLGASDVFARMNAVLDRGVQAFSAQKSVQTEVVLPEIQVFALQLGVFDSEARARSEAVRLEQRGVRCMIWKKDRLRLIADAAAERAALDMRMAGGQDAYIVSETLPEIRLSIGADAGGIDAVKAMLVLPDEAFGRMLAGAAPQTEIDRIRPIAEAAVTAHPEHALYTGLAENLIAWCDVMEPLGESAAGYAKAAMFALCRELRQALIAASTASAQRTPSTAADVMPPA